MEIYTLREITEVVYNSMAGVSFVYFKHGSVARIYPSGHSDKRNFPPGTVVLCRLQKIRPEGYRTVGFAKVTKFDNGRPTEFSHCVNDGTFGEWIPPTPEDSIADER